MADSSLSDVRVDHVILSLPTPSFEALSQFLGTDFGPAWVPVPEESKGFVYGRDPLPHVEIWNAGGVANIGPIGDQVAISSADEEDGVRKARAFYGHEGLDWGRFDAPGLITVGAECESGHPVGGTFFVAYGGPLPPGPPDVPIVSLVELTTALPRFRWGEIDTYRAFGFSEEPIDGGVVLTDSRGTRITVFQRPDEELACRGHLALQFRLTHPIAARFETRLGESARAVLEGEHLWLLLRTDVYDPFESPASGSTEG